MSRPAPMCKTCGNRHWNLSPCPDRNTGTVPFTPSDRQDRVPEGFSVKKEFGVAQAAHGFSDGLPPGPGWGAAAIPIYRPLARQRTGTLTPPPEMELPQ